MTRVVVLGAGGMLGHKVIQRLSNRFEITGTTRSDHRGVSELAIESGARLVRGVDASDFASVQRTLREIRPDVVINCIGIIKQRREAQDVAASNRINAELPHALAREAGREGFRLIHLSTDCVFSGARGHYTEADIPDPVDTYGASKLAGEVGGPNTITLRTSIVGRELHGFRSLLEWFLRQPEGMEVTGFRRAIFSGLTNIALADEIGRLIADHRDVQGVFHLSSDPITKFDLLQLFNSAFARGQAVIPDDTFHCDRSLVSARYREATGFNPEGWPAMVAALASDPTPYPRLQGA